ncbi:MAG: Hsp20/alpha crystallin family protein [Chthoniobacterales bacterium]
MKLVTYRTPPTAWTSFDRLSPLRNLLDSAFALASADPAAPTPRGWNPPLDVHEDQNTLTIRLEVAGVKKDDFDISLHDETLTISGERKNTPRHAEGESFRSERTFGAFSRRIQLPTAVKSDAVSADYTDGVLTITLPKAEEAKPKKIEVTVK